MEAKHEHSVGNLALSWHPDLCPWAKACAECLLNIHQLSAICGDRNETLVDGFLCFMDNCGCEALSFRLDTAGPA